MKLEAFKHMSFKEGPAGSMSPQNQFNRFQVAVLTKYGMNNDASVNLSGLPVMPPDYDKLMIEMAELKRKSEQAAANKKESAKLKSKVFSDIEKDCLKRQGYSGQREFSFSSFCYN